MYQTQMNSPISFETTLRACLNTPEFLNEWNRLTGCSLGVDNRNPFDRAIDEATGFQKELDKEQKCYMHLFARFVWNSIYMPLLIEYRRNNEKASK